MIKRRLLILTLLCLCVFSAFSLDSENKSNPLATDFSVSAGGRIFYNGMFDISEREWTGPASLDYYLEDNIFGNHGFGIGVFFDINYMEIGMDFIFGSFKPNSTGYSGDFELKSTHFGFSLLAKYPFAVGNLTVFPLVGIDYQIFLSGKAYGYTFSRDDCDAWYDAFSIAAGIGLDYSLGGKLYLRAELLANFKQDGERETELKDYATDNSIDFSLFTFGPRVSIGIGYKF
jgi:hypothetical protein